MGNHNIRNLSEFNNRKKNGHLILRMNLSSYLGLMFRRRIFFMSKLRFITYGIRACQRLHFRVPQTGKSKIKGTLTFEVANLEILK
jgi:hypothetical protein